MRKLRHQLVPWMAPFTNHSHTQASTPRRLSQRRDLEMEPILITVADNLLAISRILQYLAVYRHVLGARVKGGVEFAVRMREHATDLS